MIWRRNVAVLAILNLAAPFWGKPRIASFVHAVALELQELEDVFYDLTVNRTVDKATGVHLNILGRIVGEPRYARSDPAYRIALKAKILTNRSLGRWKDLLQLLEVRVTTGVRYTWREGNASIEIDSPSADVDLDREVLRFLMRAKAGGIALHMLEATGESFTYSDSSVPVYDFEHGYGSTTLSTIGGKYRTIL